VRAARLDVPGGEFGARRVEGQLGAPESVVIPDTGHDLALSTTAPLTDAIMIGWSLSVAAP
jgi:hypothetical protein